MPRPLTIAHFALLALLSAPAHAHSWYPFACCGGNDCFALPDGTVSESAAGYTIRTTGEFIPRHEARLGQDEHFHICRFGGTTGRICFFTPFRGF